MKKNYRNSDLYSSNISSNKNSEIDKIRTTNVNILLNRVRLDRKKTFKKRIIFTFSVILAICTLAVYFLN